MPTTKTNHATKPAGERHPDHALVDWMTRDAYSRSGEPTRPDEVWGYYPEDEWHEAIDHLLRAGFDVRMTVSLLNSKAARHAADSEAVLHEGLVESGLRDYYVGDTEDPYTTQHHVEEAKAEMTTLPVPISEETGLAAHVTFASGVRGAGSTDLIWTTGEVDGVYTFVSPQAAMAHERERLREEIADLQQRYDATYKVTNDDVRESSR